MLITALQQQTFIPTMQQQMITTLDVHHAAVDVRHDLAAAVDDPHHRAVADDVRHDVLIVRHDVLTTLQQQTFTQEAQDGMGDEVETMEEEGKKKKLIAKITKSNLFG